MNVYLGVYLIIILTGQSNMVRSADAIKALMPGYTVVDCSVGGTSVTQWQRGDLIYDECLARIKAEIAQGGVVAGIMHFQGEADTGAGDYDAAIQWDVLAYRFVNNIRLDVGGTAKKVPFVYAQLGRKPTDLPERPYWHLVRAKQVELTEEHPASNLRMVATWNLEPHCPEGGVHWCAEVYPVIAQRFVDKFYEVFSLRPLLGP